ncbi:hypothetical protein, partial [Klebsiella michiganensis]|uniref:hypothetical protein n=1 Tax=Klebsiella michiganensis TaxID=1134687 RepID=UPI0019548513
LALVIFLMIKQINRVKREPAAAPAAKAAAPATPSTTPAVAGSAVYPKAVDPKYAKESAGKGRQKTCLD